MAIYRTLYYTDVSIGVGWTNHDPTGVARRLAALGQGLSHGACRRDLRRPTTDGDLALGRARRSIITAPPRTRLPHRSRLDRLPLEGLLKEYSGPRCGCHGPSS